MGFEEGGKKLTEQLSVEVFEWILSVGVNGSSL